MEILLLAAVLLVLLGGAGALLAVMIVRFAQARGRGDTDGAWVSSPMVLGIAGGVLALGIATMFELNATDTALFVFCTLGIAGGIAGVIGGALVRRNRKAAGVLMLAGGAASLITIFGPMLLITGGVLALVPGKSVMEPPLAERD